MRETIVQTNSGPVAGESREGYTRWLGIPFASARRFAAPEPVEPWSAPRNATRFGRQCPQQYGNKIRREMLESEDFGEQCLNLNIWVPEGGAPGPKPVMLWIHGGAFMAGSTNPYDGHLLATEGDVIVVSANYRVGVMGFVNFGEALGIPSIPSNLGLRDQIAALEWIRDNIAAFGGDPAKVTICGQSAGSMSVSLLMLAEKARGLFRGAILQSGAVNLIHDRERSLKDARRFAELLDLDQGSLERLRTMDLADLISAQATYGGELRNAIPAAPWFDGDLLPASLEDAHRHDVAPVPVLAGATTNEIQLFELMPGDILPSKWPDLEAILRSQVGEEHAARILAAYPRTKKGRRALATDLTFAMPTRNFAERNARQSPTWFYLFDYAHPLVGAVHGLDLTVFWPFSGLKMALVRGGSASGKLGDLGRRMRADAARFVRDLSPGEGWPAYTPERRTVKIYDKADRLVENPFAERYAAWGGSDVEPGKAAL
ncbi:MAG: carboxylesterase family protein [Sphingomonadaceae bacterium]